MQWISSLAVSLAISVCVYWRIRNLVKCHITMYNINLCYLFFVHQDTLLIRYDSHQLEVGTSDVASGTLKKTIK